jgi:hypothetical protein
VRPWLAPSGEEKPALEANREGLLKNDKSALDAKAAKVSR